MKSTIIPTNATLIKVTNQTLFKLLNYLIFYEEKLQHIILIGNEIANMNLLMILKLNYREVAQARWKKRIFQIPSNFCERIVTHLEVSKTEVECFITRFQTPWKRQKHEAVGRVFSNWNNKKWCSDIFSLCTTGPLWGLSLLLRERQPWERFISDEKHVSSQRKTWRCLMWCFASYQDSSTWSN